MQLTALTADLPLVKTFSFEGSKVTKTPYPNAYRFTSHHYEFEAMSGFMTALEETIKQQGCLLKGTINQPLKHESRAGSTDPQAATQWICLDLDRLTGYSSVDELLESLKLGDVSYIIQPSASSLISGDKSISAHVFMLLSNPVEAPLLKQWLMHLNLTTERIRDSITLTRTAHALHWPIDITCCQNDKLIFVAEPILEGKVPSKLKSASFKPQYIERGKAHLPVTRMDWNFSVNRSRSMELLNKLRAAAGMEKIKTSQYKHAGAIQYVDKPNEAILTGIKKERGFVYLNLNGGDSWGYYHPEDAPEFIHNFKGEPSYKTQDLLPAYWHQLEQEKTEQPVIIKYFVGRDFYTDRFFNGMYNTATDKLTIARASTEARLISFLKQHGQPVPDFIQDWTIGYFPDKDFQFDEENHTINLYCPSEYFKLKRREVKRIPPITKKIISSAVGEGETFEHFMNWLACIVQYKVKTQTCWVLHGIQGTGKGLLMHNILTPLLGESNTAMLQMSQLEEHYNGWAENTLITMVDEAQIRTLRHNSTINANLKSIITDPIVNVRRMYTEPYRAKSYVNLLFASNQPDPVQIDTNDRRFNVGVYQTKRLKITSEEVAQLKNELEDTFMYLSSRKADLDKARLVMQTEDRRLLINISRTSIDSVVDHILEGDLQFFVDQLPTSDSPVFSTPACIAYKQLIDMLVATKPKVLLRDDIFTLLDYCIGDMPRSPHKFTSLLKHHRIYTQRLRADGHTRYGIQVDWKQPTDLPPSKNAPANSSVIPMRKQK